MSVTATRGSWLLVLCALAPACTYLVEPEAEQIGCAISDRIPNPCPTGLVCVDEVCVAPPRCQGSEMSCPAHLVCRDNQCIDPASCAVSPDVCGDNIDNDCDGKTDEVADPADKDVCGDGKDNDCDGEADEGHDGDNDGFDWCGDPADPTAGGPTKDCLPEDPDSHPGAREICDGFDNDCDQRTDEADGTKSLCAAGETCVGHCVQPSCANDGALKCKPNEMCDSNTGKCVPRSCETDCPVGQFCDATTGMCTSSKRANGTACASHDECQSGSCIESAALRLRTAARYVCGHTCCGDADCGAGERCFSSGTGARSCLPVALAANVDDAACARGQDCATGNVCRFEEDLSVSGTQLSPRTDLVTSVCAPLPSGALQLGDECDGWSRNACPSGECVASSYGSGSSSRVCTMTCGRSEDCAPFKAALGTSAHVYCAFGTPLTDSSEGDVATACIVSLSGFDTPKGGQGASCQNGGECLDRGCVVAAGSGSGFCASTCCNDSQCSPMNGEQTFCRPVAFGGHFETRCIP